MYKGIFKIDAYEAISNSDGTYEKGDFIECRAEQRNRITPRLEHMIRAGDSDGRTQIDEFICVVNEGIFVGALDMDNTDTYGGSLTRGTNAVDLFYTSATDPFWTVTTTISPPLALDGTRNIRTVALGTLDSSASADCYAIVSLSSPCPQAPGEILQITYRIVLDTSVAAAQGGRSAYTTERQFASNVLLFPLTNQNAFGTDSVYAGTFDSTVWGKGIRVGSGYPSTGTFGSIEIFVSTFREANNEKAPRQGVLSAEISAQFGNNDDPVSNSDFTGFPIKSYGLGAVDATSVIGPGLYTIADVSKGTLSSIQNTFGRTADATGNEQRSPFLDNSIIASSAASVNLVDKGDWLEYLPDSYCLPYLYKITMETGGLVGAATYKVRRRPFARFADNDVDWAPLGIAMPHMNMATSGALGEVIDIIAGGENKVERHGQYYWGVQGESSTNLDQNFWKADVGLAGYTCKRYVWPEWINYDYTGLTISDANVNYINIDTNATNAQAFTELLQIATDGLDIYAADAQGGLIKIERSMGDFLTANFTYRTLTPPGITSTVSCRGVVGKGGDQGHIGPMVDVRVQRAGSNYAVGDTITITGVNGTGATANVARVDADGGITSVAVTAQGSGYLQDHIQAYASTGTGVGAQLMPIVGCGGDIWAIFNDTTDDVVYMTHMTHVGSNDYTSLAIDSGADTITRTGGTDFLVDGFRPGQELIVRSAEDATNEGTYTISTVTSTVITLTDSITTTNATDTQMQIFAESWEVMRETITTTESLTFADANPDTITGSGTSFITQGFVEGMTIVISGSVSNNGTYTIAGVTATVITLDSQDTLVAEGPVSCTMAALTDFTIASYTGNSTEGAGIIGVLIDPSHADDRMAILTPTTKTVNNGTTDVGTSGWDWWSFANSTGTTAAGTTDRVRVTATTGNEPVKTELLAPLALGPMTDGDFWITIGEELGQSSTTVWGTNTSSLKNYGIQGTYAPLRNRSGFDITIKGRGGVGTNERCTRNLNADMNTVGAFDTMLCEDDTGPPLTDWSPSAFDNLGASWGYLGGGYFWYAKVPGGNNPHGFAVYTYNGDGTRNQEDAMHYGTWQEFGWDGTRWVLDNAGARTTHAQSTFSGSSLDINATTGAIVGTGFASTDWAGDGFEVGDIITIATAEDVANNGQYVIESLSGTTLTVTPDKLPAVTNVADTTATVVGDRALIDGLAVSFDDNAAADAFVIDEYYDTYVFNGIIKDNATKVETSAIFSYAASDAGTTFSAGTVPGADRGAVTEPVGALYFNYGSGSISPGTMVEPGIATFDEVDTTGYVGHPQIPASTDFEFSFKTAGTDATHDCVVGIAPWTTISDGTDELIISEVDENIKVIYDFATNPTLDLYDIQVRSVGNGGVLSTYNANRIVTIVNQDETNFNGAGGNGTFIGGDGVGGTAHVAADVITMDDGSTVTVDTVDGNGDVTEFTISTKSTQTRGAGEAGIGSNDYTSLDFAIGGPSTITRTGGTAFDTDGFEEGMRLVIESAEDSGNNGVYTITDVTATVITLENPLSTNNATDTTAQINTALVQSSSTGSGTRFALILGSNNEASADIGGDKYSIKRTGTGAGAVSWYINDVRFYTYAGAIDGEVGVCAVADGGDKFTIYDMEITYTDNRRILTVGNGTTTGANDPNFRCLPSVLAGTPDRLQLFYDTGSGPIEFTYLDDSYTAPASGEVNLGQFTGQLWFNSAQATDTITGSWVITKKINLT